MSTEFQFLGGVSGQAVFRATGKPWEEWLEVLDRAEAREMNHRQIVALLAEVPGLSSGWWQQTIAVGYEQARGLRTAGQTAGAGFQIGVQKTLPVASELAWDLLVDGPGRDLWLGPVEGLEMVKGGKYRTAQGFSGEVRSVSAGERVRLTWQNGDLAGPSTLQVTLVSSGDKTSVRFHQERLSNQEERELMRRHWRQVLEKLQELL